MYGDVSFDGAFAWCAQGESCLKSHDAQDPQNEIDTEIAFDSGMNVNTVSEITAGEVKRKNRGKKGQGKAKKTKIAHDISTQVAALSREIPDDAKDYFKRQCELMI